jgi:Uma2 family endonuclease
MMTAEEYIARFVDAGEKPACEYIDGVLHPKPPGSKKHSQVQANITKLIGNRYDETLNPLPELTARLRETQFYVPDLAIEELAKPIQGRYPGPK